MSVCNYKLILTISVGIVYSLMATDIDAQQNKLLERLGQELDKRPSSVEVEKTTNPLIAKSNKEPLKRAEELMLQASERIRLGKTNQDTQQLQIAAIQALDEWISQTEQQKSEQRSEPQQIQPQSNARQAEQKKQESGNDATKQDDGGEQQPASDGGKRSGSQSGNTPTSVAGEGDSNEEAMLPSKVLSRGVWGHLPERMRRQLDAVSAEQYLPAYRRLIENYYRRLSEQSPARRVDTHE